MKVSLIRLPLVAPAGSLNNEPTPPLGLAYLAGALKRAGFSVQGIDATGQALDRIRRVPGKQLQINGIDIEDAVGQIDLDAKVIAVAAMFSHEWTVVRGAIEAIRTRCPNSAVIVGGEHASAVPEYILRDCPAIDFVGLGEGEELIVEFCRTMESGGDFGEVAGLCFLDTSGEFVRTPPRTRMRDVASIAWPDWTVFPIEPYLDNAISFGAGSGRNMPIMASRGCPYQCTFCSNPQMWTTRYYVRPPDDVIAEIELYKDKYNITGLQFYDLTAIVKKAWVVEFCQKYIQHGISLEWSLPSGTRSEALDEEALGWLAKAKLRYLVYAPESGSERTLRLIKKKIKPRRMVDSMRAAIKRGITVRANWIIGFPHETRMDILKTLRTQFMYTLYGAEECPIFPFQPYPGSELFCYLQEKGEIKLDDDFFDSLATLSTGRLLPPKISFCEHVGRRELYAYRLVGIMANIFFAYITRPARIIRTIRSLFSSRSDTVLEQRLKDQLRKHGLRKPMSQAAAGKA